jgi:hypothetical protein
MHAQMQYDMIQSLMRAMTLFTSVLTGLALLPLRSSQQQKAARKIALTRKVKDTDKKLHVLEVPEYSTVPFEVDMLSLCKPVPK